VVDANAVAAACSATVVWEDMNAAEPANGREAVRSLLASKFPAGARLSLERLSDGASSGGFTWHRESASRPGQLGLRGTLFAELDGNGLIAYVREGSEPIFKPGEAIEALLTTATQLVGKPEKPTPTFTPKTPTAASDIVRYLWQDAYPGGAEPTEAIRFFSDAIRYEDFNYEEPFIGLAAVTDFVTAFDIPGVEFVPLRISEGSSRCAFTWKVVVNGQDGPSGISFYEVDAQGKVCFIRDIPAPSIKPPPLGRLAAFYDPELRVFASRE